MNRPFIFKVLLSATAVFVGLCLSHLRPANGQKVATSQFPLIAPALPPGKTGYSIFIETDGCSVDRGGYQPYRFTIETNPCKTVVEDKRFLVSVSDLYYSGGMIVTAQLQIKAGQSSGTTELLLTDHSTHNWLSYTIKSERDGVICSSHFSAQNQNANTYDSANLMPNTLLISSQILQPGVQAHAVIKKHTWDHSTQPLQKKKGESNLPSIHIAQQAFQHPSVNQPEYDDAFSAVTNWNHVSAYRPVDLSTNWAALSNFDQIFLSISDLKSLSKQSGQRDALRQWVVAGGTLIVLDPKSQFKIRDQVFPLLIGADRATMLDTPFDRWTIPAKWLDSIEETIVDPSTITERWVRQNFFSSGGAFVDIQNYQDRPDGEVVSNRDFRDGISSPFIMQRFANGLILLVDDNAKDWSEQDWRYFYNSVRIENLPLSEHLGSGNGSFFAPSFWIPGIGDPPVLAFQFLIALFMVVAGPVMLLVLKRTRRMQLLFTIIPLLSIFTCGSLFAYAILSDGLVTLGRARTFTRIDSRTGDAVTHARASYYKGMQPAPYRFDQGTFVVQNSGSRGSLRVRRDQRDDYFRYSGGRIRARSPHQIVSTRPYETRRGLRVFSDELSDKSKRQAVRFQNNLKTDAELVIFRIDEEYFFATDIGAGKTQLAVATDLIEVAKIVNQVHHAHTPEVHNYMRRGEAQKQWSGNVPPRFLGDEHRVSKLLASGKLSSAMPKNSWLAITTSFEPAEKELGDAQIKHMLHFITGDWQP